MSFEARVEPPPADLPLVLLLSHLLLLAAMSVSVSTSERPGVRLWSLDPPDFCDWRSNCLSPWRLEPLSTSRPAVLLAPRFCVDEELWEPPLCCWRPWLVWP